VQKTDGGDETGVIRTLREQLGHELTSARLLAGWSQSELARRIGYSRSTVSTEESGRGSAHAARSFWERCDQVFGTAGRFTSSFDRIKEEEAAGRLRARRARARQSAGQEPVADGGWLQRFRQTGQTMNAATPREALRVYADLGWSVHADGDRLELQTGTVIDALELSRVAGTLAAHWWLHSLGVPDAIRGLPALPHPQEALSVIAAGSRHYFLVQAGTSPWDGWEGRLAGVPASPRRPVVRWHGARSRILLPPSRDADGQRAEWLYFSMAGTNQLAVPIALLDLLAKAAAGVTEGAEMLELPGGVLVAPAFSD